MNAVRPSTDGRTGIPRPRSEQGVGELVAQASQQISDLVRQEMRLAMIEIKDKGRHAGKGAGMFGGAGAVALYGVAALVLAAIAALALVLPLWASALIVGVILLIVAAALALAGRSQVKQAMPPVPREAMDSARQDVAEIKGRVRR